ncbi:LIM domain only protein 3-like protein, partial [Leptotrombidium deliense]
MVAPTTPPSAHSTHANSANSAYPECAGCRKAINERYLLKAVDKLWHEDCLKCACCDCRL